MYWNLPPHISAPKAVCALPEDIATKIPVHLRITECTTDVRDLPHSKQDAFSRDVINPHDGHIL